MKIKIYRTAHKKTEEPDVINICGQFDTTCHNCGLSQERITKEVEVAKVPFGILVSPNDCIKRLSNSRMGRTYISKCTCDNSSTDNTSGKLSSCD